MNPPRSNPRSYVSKKHMTPDERKEHEQSQSRASSKKHYHQTVKTNPEKYQRKLQTRADSRNNRLSLAVLKQLCQSQNQTQRALGEAGQNSQSTLVESQREVRGDGEHTKDLISKFGTDTINAITKVAATKGIHLGAPSDEIDLVSDSDDETPIVVSSATLSSSRRHSTTITADSVVSNKRVRDIQGGSTPQRCRRYSPDTTGIINRHRRLVDESSSSHNSAITSRRFGDLSAEIQFVLDNFPKHHAPTFGIRVDIHRLLCQGCLNIGKYLDALHALLYPHLNPAQFKKMILYDKLVEMNKYFPTNSSNLYSLLDGIRFYNDHLQQTYGYDQEIEHLYLQIQQRYNESIVRLHNLFYYVFSKVVTNNSNNNNTCHPPPHQY